MKYNKYLFSSALQRVHLLWGSLSIRESRGIKIFEPCLELEVSISFMRSSKLWLRPDEKMDGACPKTQDGGVKGKGATHQ